VQQRSGFEKADKLDTVADVYNGILLNHPSDNISTINKQTYSGRDHMRQAAAWQRNRDSANKELLAETAGVLVIQSKIQDKGTDCK